MKHRSLLWRFALLGLAWPALAVASPTRLAALPSLPTLRELGVGDIDVQIWLGLFARSGTPAAYAIAMALFVRERTGVGQFIDIALYDTSIQAMQLSYLARYLGDGTLPGRHGSGHPSMVPAQAFQAGDGAWFNVVANTDAMWAALCQALHDPELARDARFAERGARAEHAASVLALLEARFATQPRAVWLERFKAVGLPC